MSLAVQTLICLFSIHSSVSPSPLWNIALAHPKALENCAYVIKLFTRMKIRSNCSVCLKAFDDGILHCAFECQNYTNVIKRAELYNNLLSSLSSDSLDFIMALPCGELLNVMMGGNSGILMRIWDKSVYVKFILISVHFLLY